MPMFASMPFPFVKPRARHGMGTRFVEGNMCPGILSIAYGSRSAVFKPRGRKGKFLRQMKLSLYQLRKKKTALQPVPVPKILNLLQTKGYCNSCMTD
eukprot:scaffold12367_cov20-Tisochrysis_lutea.AAC.1